MIGAEVTTSASSSAYASSTAVASSGLPLFTSGTNAQDCWRNVGGSGCGIGCIVRDSLKMKYKKERGHKERHYIIECSVIVHACGSKFFSIFFPSPVVGIDVRKFVHRLNLLQHAEVKRQRHVWEVIPIIAHAWHECYRSRKLST